MPATGQKNFPKLVRLRTPHEFRRVYETGTKRTSTSFVLFVQQNRLTHSRFGVTTPRKLGKAHDRNRIKRRVREILRTSYPQIPPGFDFVINPKRVVVDREFEKLQVELLKLIGSQL